MGDKNKGKDKTKDPAAASATSEAETDAKTPFTMEAFQKMLDSALDRRLAGHTEQITALVVKELGGRSPKDPRASPSTTQSRQGPSDQSGVGVGTGEEDGKRKDADKTAKPTEKVQRTPTDTSGRKTAARAGVAPLAQGLDLVRTMVGAGGDDVELGEDDITDMLIRENLDADDPEKKIEPSSAVAGKRSASSYTPGSLIALFANQPLRSLPSWFDKIAKAPTPKALKTKADVDAKWWAAQTVLLSIASGGLPFQLDKNTNWRDLRNKHECKQLALIIHLLLLGQPDLALEAACRRYEGCLLADSRANFKAATALNLLSDSPGTVSGGDADKLELIAPSTAAASAAKDTKGKAKATRTGALEDAAAALAADKGKAAPSGQSGGPGGRGGR